MQRGSQQGNALTNQKSCLIKRSKWADEWGFEAEQWQPGCQGPGKASGWQNISTFTATSTELFLFDPGCYFMIRTINAFVTVVNVSLAVCSALSHTLLSMQLCPIRKPEGGYKHIAMTSELFRILSPKSWQKWNGEKICKCCEIPVIWKVDFKLQ